MKKLYADSTLKKKYRETGIPKAALEKLHLYFCACANFYKALNVNDVWTVVKKTERYLGKTGLKNFLDQKTLDSIRMYLLDELYRDMDEREVLNDPDELERREAAFLEDEFDNVQRIAEILAVPLIPDGPGFNTGDYELTREDFDKVIAIKERSCDRYFVLQEDDLFSDGDAGTLYLVDIPTVMEIADGEMAGFDMAPAAMIINEAGEKPLLVPKDLFCYISSMYYEETPQTDRMEEFLLKTFYADADLNDEDEAEEVEFDIRHMLFAMERDITRGPANPTETIDQAIAGLETQGFLLKDMKQTEQFIQLLMDICNNTRLPANKGNTPLELASEESLAGPPHIQFGPGIQEMIRSGEWDATKMKRDIMTTADLPIELRGDIMREVDRALEPGEERVINASGTIVKGRKIKPNEPCPCGSGKKYKHCCGRDL